MTVSGGSPGRRAGPRFRFDIERAERIGGRLVVAGADEAGRGALAGPLVAAAVAFDYSAWRPADFRALAAVDDSKRLSRQRREELYTLILRRALLVTSVACAPATIDGRGLHVCNLAALAEALRRLAPAPSVLLVDGLSLPDAPPPCEVVVGGDGRSAAIAAASIIAKVTRDRLMRRLHERYPDWRFDEHVGYGTRAHQEAIVRHGLCPLHRRSFQSAAYQRIGPPV